MNHIDTDQNLKFLTYPVNLILVGNENWNYQMS